MTIRLGLILCAALALSGCQSARFSDASAGRTRGPVFNAPAAAPAPELVPAAPSAAVSSEPLPPPPGASAAADPVYPPPLSSGPIVADVPAMPGGPGPIEPLRPTVEPAPQRVAVAAPGRSSVVGGWNAREASGSCRVQLSSAPALDLYKASAAGCGNRDLARVTAWDFRDGEVFLYQPGGAVAARLRPSGGSLEGVLAKSGGPLTLAR